MTTCDQKISPASILELLKTISIFDDLDPQELKTIVSYMQTVNINPNETVFREGDRGDYVCFVADGILDVVKTSEPGNRVVISTLQKGRSIGEMAVLDNFPRSASVVACTEATLLTLSRDNFAHILTEHPRTGIKILKGMARLLSLNLRKTSSRLADYMLPVT